jgi:hypothetical protein
MAIVAKALERPEPKMQRGITGPILVDVMGEICFLRSAFLLARRLHVRITNGKANAGPLGKAKWMKLVVERLANGDAVAVASPFSPPDPFKNERYTIGIVRNVAMAGRAI